MPVGITNNSVEIEFSEEELDAVAGGASLFETNNFFQDQRALASVTSSGPKGSQSVTEAASNLINTGVAKHVIA